jgi:hypothetical protein
MPTRDAYVVRNTVLKTVIGSTKSTDSSRIADVCVEPVPNSDPSTILSNREAEIGAENH